MRIEKSPDFSKKEDEVLVLDNREKKQHIITVVFDDLQSHMDFENKRIVINKNLPDNQKKFVLQHEVEHLNKKLVSPWWVLSIPGFKLAEYFSMEAKTRIEKEVLDKLLSNPDPKLRLLGITVDAFLPQTLDNYIEDFFINKHLIKNHRINKSSLEELYGLGTLSSVKYFRRISDAYSQYFGVNVNRIEEPLKVQKNLFSNSHNVGYLVNSLADCGYCLTEKMKLIDFYELTKKGLKRVVDSVDSEDIFSEVLLHKVKTELERLNQIQTILEILKSNKNPFFKNRSVKFLFSVYQSALSRPELSKIL